jgi:hypothetical protein
LYIDSVTPANDDLLQLTAFHVNLLIQIARNGLPEDGDIEMYVSSEHRERLAKFFARKSHLVT